WPRAHRNLLEWPALTVTLPKRTDHATKPIKVPIESIAFQPGPGGSMKKLAPLILLFTTAPAFAQQPDPKKLATTPPAELSALKYFIGTWSCEGKGFTPAAMGGKEFPNKEKVTFAQTLDGFWLAGTFESEKIPGMPFPTPGKSENRASYDRGEK